MGIMKIVKGLKSLQIAVMPTSGLIADAKFEQLSLNLEGTFKMNQEEDTQTKIYVEEQDAALDTILKKGDFMFETDIPDYQYDVVHRLLGATKKEVWVEGAKVQRVSLPDSAQYIYMMFKIIPKDGIEQFFITRGQVSAYMTGNLSKTEPLNIHLKVTALIPLIGEDTAVKYDIKEGTNPGYLLGDPLDKKTTIWATLWGSLTGASAGGVILTVDGDVQSPAIADVDFSAITGGQDIVDILNGLTTKATWSWDEDAFRFKVTSNTVGSASTILVAAGSTTNIIVESLLNMAGVTPVAGS